MSASDWFIECEYDCFTSWMLLFIMTHTLKSHSISTEQLVLLVLQKTAFCEFIRDISWGRRITVDEHRGPRALHRAAHLCECRICSSPLILPNFFGLRSVMRCKRSDVWVSNQFLFPSQHPLHISQHALVVRCWFEVAADILDVSALCKSLLENKVRSQQQRPTSSQHIRGRDWWRT